MSAIGYVPWLHSGQRSAMLTRICCCFEWGSRLYGEVRPTDDTDIPQLFIPGGTGAIILWILQDPEKGESYLVDVNVGKTEHASGEKANAWDVEGPVCSYLHIAK